MSFLLPSGGIFPSATTFPWTLIKAGVTAGTTSKTASISTGGKGLVLITHVDMTVTGVEPSQWHAEAILSNAGFPFFHDSQSTGEGLGISFYWRGMLVMDNFETLTLKLTNISGVTPANLGFYASAHWIPQTPQFP